MYKIVQSDWLRRVQYWPIARSALILHFYTKATTRTDKQTFDSGIIKK